MVCPGCGAATARMHGYYGRTVADVPVDGRRVLEQETRALLTLYQLLRMAMATAIETRPGTDPDRAASPPRWKPPKTSSPPPPDGPGRPGRTARRDRPGRAGHLAARPQAPGQRPQGQMRHLPVPQP